MKVVFNIVLNVVAIDSMFAELAVTKSNDYYEHVGHGMAARRAAWAEEGNPINDLMKEIHVSAKRTRPGYMIDDQSVSYCTSAGNCVWIKRLADKQKIEIGYKGTRHGMSHMFRIVNDNMLDGVKPVTYETTEKGWLWHETRNQAVIRITGKDMRDWKDMPVGIRAKRLAQMDVTKRMTDIVLGL